MSRRLDDDEICSRARGGNLFAYSISKAGVNAITGFVAVIGNTAVFLASEESRFVTGLELPVDGGTLAFVGQYSGSPDPAAQAKQGGSS